MSWSVVVPTNRPEQYEPFLEAWGSLFLQHEVNIIPVLDTPGEWNNRPDWIPRQTDMCRSWGIYEAWLAGSTYTLSLDDDVRPLPGVDIFAEYEAAFETPAFCSEYLSVGDLTTKGFALRGFPYRDRDMASAAIQYGGWHGVLDYDAATQLVAKPGGAEDFAPVSIPVPRNVPVTTCIMNAAWRTEFAPIMWQLPLYEGKYNRFGDIWAGLLSKKVLDALGHVMLINGCASVHHQRASDPVANLEREAPGIRVNETLWEYLCDLLGYAYEVEDDMLGLYREALDAFASHPDLDPAYAAHFREASSCWLGLFA